MATLCKMLRIVLFPLLLLLLSMACTGQTFQYSRGWTNGKRSALNAHLHRDEDTLPEIYELQDGERKLEKCLMQLQHFLRNPLMLHAGGALTMNSNPNGNSNNPNNNLFGNHHQSNELYEEMNAVEPSDYVKH